MGESDELLFTGLQLSRRADPHNDILVCATEIRKSQEKLKDHRLIKDTAADWARILSWIAWDRSRRNIIESSLIVNVSRRWVSAYSGMNHG